MQIRSCRPPFRAKLKGQVPGQYRGFTLIELMVTVALFAILATVAVSSFEALVKTNRVKSNVNTLLVAFKTARSEAVKRGQPVSLSAASGGYTEGWCIYQGAAGTACNNIGNPIRQFEGSDGINVNANGDASVQFDAQGRLAVPAGSNVRIGITSAEGSGSGGRTLCIGLSGRAQITEGGCP